MARRLHGRCEREGGTRREVLRKWGGICCGKSKRKMCFLVVPRRTNSNKHLLGGLVFWGGLDGSNPN